MGFKVVEIDHFKIAVGPYPFPWAQDSHPQCICRLLGRALLHGAVQAPAHGF